MQSTVQLFNTALARLGGEQLDTRISPQETDTLGQLCTTLFAHVLDMALAAHEWSFALRRVALAPVPELFGGRDVRYPNAFQIPADCVRAIRLAEDGGVNRSQPFIIEGDCLRAGQDAATLVYVQRVSDPRAWPPAFADALAWAMASELASARLNNTRKQQWAMQNFQIALAAAIARDCAGQNRLAPVSAWKAARFGMAAAQAERF